MRRAGSTFGRRLIIENNKNGAQRPAQGAPRGAQGSGGPRRNKKKKMTAGRVLGAIMRFIASCLCVCIILGSVAAVAVSLYVVKETQGDSDLLDLTQLELAYTTIIYSQQINDQGQPEWVEYQRLQSPEENRIWKPLNEISPYIQHAFVAVEDENFYTHPGFSFKRTVLAAINEVFRKLTGSYLTGSQLGASTIEQQLIKNITEDKDYSIKRKVNEIFRAFALEKEIDDKDRILVMYLNTIYLGYNSYGVQTAADRYFGKDVSQLDLAECAVLAGLTNNPSIYDVYNHPDKVKSRQETILSQMLDQKMITEDEYNAAVSEQLNYRPYEEYQKDVKSTYSYFTDEVIKDVIGDLKEQKGYSELVAENMVYSGGLKIYATIDTKVQDALDSVYTDDSAFPNTEKYGEVPESAMVITDKQGDIVAIAGGRGQKTLSRSFSFATDARRQPGSSFKPLASYGPAMDAGIIVPSTTIYDRAFSEGEDGMPWPMNSKSEAKRS